MPHSMWELQLDIFVNLTVFKKDRFILPWNSLLAVPTFDEAGIVKMFEVPIAFRSAKRINSGQKDAKPSWLQIDLQVYWVLVACRGCKPYGCSECSNLATIHEV